MTIPALPIEHLRAQLDAALAWLESVGIRTHNTRLARYRGRLDEVVAARDADRTTLSQANTFYLAAMSEAAELVRIVEGAQRLELSDELRRRLEVVRDGPYAALDEWRSDGQRRNNRARDIGFELVSASLFTKADIDTSLSLDGDLEFRLRGRQILVECKRIGSPELAAVKARTEKAFAQIRTRRRAKPQALGIVCIDLTPSLNQQTQCWETADEALMRQGLDNVQASVRDGMRACWRKGFFGPDTLGILVRFVTLVRVVELDLENLYHQWWFDTHYATRKELAPVIHALGTAISTSIPSEEFSFEVR